MMAMEEQETSHYLRRMSFNSTYKIPKDASYVTLRNQNRMLYANYVIQQNNVQQGCQVRAELQNGGVADGDIIPKLLEGARATTAAERDAEVASEACPVTVTPVDPYLTDKIYLSLTTNAAAYKAAASGTWVAVTSIEYTTIQTNVTNTSLCGLDSTTLGTIGGDGFTAGDFAVTNTPSSVATNVPANSYFFAFSIKIKATPTTTLNAFRVYTNNSTSTYSGFIQRGQVLPALSGGLNYFVLKGVSNVSAATNGLLAISAPGDGTVDAQSSHLVFGNVVGASAQASTTASLPLSSSATLSTTFSRAFGIQGLASTSIQWVT